MSPHRFVSVALAAAVLLVTGCDGPFRDDIAATVGDVDITTKQVEDLVAEGPEVDPVDTPGRVSSDSRRAALSQLIIEEVKKQHEQELASTPPEITDADVEAFFESNREQFVGLLCLEGLAALPERAEQALADLRGGASFDDVVAGSPDQVFPLTQQGTAACVARDQLNADAELGPTILGAPVGEFVSRSVVAQSGEQITVIVRVSGEATALHPGIAPVIRSQLTENAQQELQTDVLGRIERLLRTDVVVDPRYGRVELSASSVLAPPLSPTTIPAPIAVPAPAGP